MLKQDLRGRDEETGVSARLRRTPFSGRGDGSGECSGRGDGSGECEDVLSGGQECGGQGAWAPIQAMGTGRRQSKRGPALNQLVESRGAGPEPPKLLGREVLQAGAEDPGQFLADASPERPASVVGAPRRPWSSLLISAAWPGQAQDRQNHRGQAPGGRGWGLLQTQAAPGAPL